MSDPFTMIAAGAAIGGLAGKVTEKAWESGERWLRERFGSHTAEARQQAHKNAAQFVQQLTVHVNVLDHTSKVNSERVAAAEKDPQFSALMQKSFINAAQTSDANKLDLLARLVATRLASATETTISLASQLASDAISRSTKRQLEMMAVCCFLEDIRPRDPLPVTEYRAWIEAFLKPFANLEFQDYDARHLVAIACASYDPETGRDLQILLKMKGGTHCLSEDFRGVQPVELLQFQWDAGLAGVRLTSVGSIVGGLSINQLFGIDSGLPAWD